MTSYVIFEIKWVVGAFREGFEVLLKFVENTFGDLAQLVPFDSAILDLFEFEKVVHGIEELLKGNICVADFRKQI